MGVVTLFVDDIRVTYSGLIAFAVAMISLVTGTVFVILTTRQLAPEEFGVWTIIGAMIGYILVSHTIIAYWTTRQIARGDPVGRTSVVSSGVLLAGLVPAYLALVYVYSPVSPEFHNSLILSIVLVPAVLLNGVLVSINLGYQPHKVSYSLLVFECAKVPFGLVLVYVLDWGLDGVILAVLGAHICQISVQIYYLRDKLASKFNPAYLYRWMRMSWIPLYTTAGSLVWDAGIIITPILVGSVSTAAYFGAALAIAAVPAYTANLSQAVYPRLLASEQRGYISENLTKQIFFLLPLTGAIIAFAEPALFTLNPLYQGAYMAVILLAFNSFATSLIHTANRVLTGIEKVDVEHSPRFVAMLRSKLFLVPTLLIISNAAYVVCLVLVMPLIADGDQMFVVMVWSAIPAAASIPAAAYLWFLARQSVEVAIPWRRVMIYLLATLVFMGAYTVTAEHILTYSDSIFEHIWQVVQMLVLCFAIYLGITYLADRNTRHLTRSILAEIRHMAHKE